MEELKCTLSAREELKCKLGQIEVEGLSAEPLSVTENGTYTAPYGKAYTPVTVDVEGLIPTGTLQITENGMYDVTEKASAEVSVKQWDSELTEILDGSATELSGLPSGVTKIKPYAFYNPTQPSPIPSEYTPMKYAESVGNVYLLTNLTYASGKAYIVEIEMEGTNTSINDNGIGWNAGGGVYFRSSRYTNGSSADTATSNPAYNEHVVVTINMTTIGTSAYAYYDLMGQQINTSQRPNTSLKTYADINYPLFAMSSANGLNKLLYAPCRIYRFKAWENNVLKCDYYPAKINGEVGFYNLVDGTFYRSGGTGSLTGEESPIIHIDTLQTADTYATEIGDYAFYNNDLTSLTLRAQQVVALGSNALDGTPIADGNGYIYVPSDLLSDYQADSAWSKYSSKIRAI